ncbi:MAG: L,D-transpeptidase family protein [Woeseiaceae bacterium]
MSKMHRISVFIVGMFLTGGLRGEDLQVTASGNSLLPAYLLEVPESVTDILIADAGAATMHRFERSGNEVVAIDKRYMSIGTAGAGKQRAWDRKTPLGVYFITDSLDTSKMHDKYGVAAFPLDYPNAWDTYNERTGYGIWLHGVDHKDPQRPPLDTDGCLAISNDGLSRLVGRLQPLITPVIVTREIEWAAPTDIDALRSDFRTALDTWRDSLASGDLFTYLSMYADDFRYRDMDRDSWASFRYNVFDAQKLGGVTLADVFLVADPEVPGLYLSRFTQILKTTDGPVTTTKRLYWRRSEDNRWRIVAEDAG